MKPAALEDSLPRLVRGLPSLLGGRLPPSRCRLECRVRPDGIILHVEFAGEPPARGDVLIQPRGFANRQNPPVLTGSFQAFYSESGGAPWTEREQSDLRTILEALGMLLSRFEKTLSAGTLQAWRESLRPPAPAGGGAAADLVRDVLGNFEADSLRGPEEAIGREHILRVTFACNQDCGFCFVDLSKRLVSLEEIEKALDTIPRAVREADELTISGGEPTSHPRLPEIVALAREKGFRSILIQTNAVHLSRPGLAERLGPVNYFVSFHSHVPEIYDRLTASRSQFAPAVRGLKNVLRDPKNVVDVNIVVTKLNYDRLAEHMAFLDELREKRPLRVFFSLLNHVGLSRTPELAVDMAQVRPHLNAAVRTALKLGLDVSSFSGNCSPPVCLLDDPGPRACQGSYSQGDVRYQESFAGEDAQGRAKSPACRTCRYDPVCRGVPVLYAQRFGLGALKPAG